MVIFDRSSSDTRVRPCIVIIHCTTTFSLVMHIPLLYERSALPSYLPQCFTSTTQHVFSCRHHPFGNAQSTTVFGMDHWRLRAPKTLIYVCCTASHSFISRPDGPAPRQRCRSCNIMNQWVCCAWFFLITFYGPVISDNHLISPMHMHDPSSPNVLVWAAYNPHLQPSLMDLYGRHGQLWSIIITRRGDTRQPSL